MHLAEYLLIQIPLPGKEQDPIQLMLLRVTPDPLAESHHIETGIDKSHFIIRAVMIPSAVEPGVDRSPR